MVSMPMSGTENSTPAIRNGDSSCVDDPRNTASAPIIRVTIPADASTRARRVRFRETKAASPIWYRFRPPNDFCPKSALSRTNVARSAGRALSM